MPAGSSKARPRLLSPDAIRKTHIVVPAVYFLLSATYIAVSDLVVAARLSSSAESLAAGLSKGLGFVLATSVLLWWLLRREYRSRFAGSARFGRLVESLPDAVFLVTLPDRTIRYANPAAVRLFGHDVDELIGMPARALHVDDETYREFDRLGEEALATGRPFLCDYHMRRRDGRVFPTSHLVSVLPGEDGQMHALSVVRDESRQKVYQAQLRQQEQLLRTIADTLNEVFWLSDARKKRVYYVSPGYERIFGRPAAELYEDPLSFLAAILEEDRPVVKERLRRQVEGPWEAEYRIRRPDGAIRWIWDRAMPMADPDGVVRRVAGVAEDVTEMKEREREHRQAQNLEALGQLTGGIAHDFNNLLTIIFGHADELAEESPTTSPVHASARSIISACERATALIRRLLAFSSRQGLEPRRVAVNELVRGTIHDLLARVLREDIRIESDLAGDAWDVRADPLHLETSLLNLAVNARDAMPQGGRLHIGTRNVSLGEREAEQRAGLAPGDYVALVVSDTGTGMPPDIAERVFDPFFTTKPADQGTGLGLSMVYGFVNEIGGHVSVRSQPGLGTTFELLLPRYVEEPEEDELPAALDTMILHGFDPNLRETVLVVEDEAALRARVTETLRELGYAVRETATADEALGVLESDDPVTLLFTDVGLPGGMHGPALATRALMLRPELPVLFTSGYWDTRSLPDDGIPVEPILRKPYSRRKLASMVRRAIDGR